jgi:hypothetical protein
MQYEDHMCKVYVQFHGYYSFVEVKSQMVILNHASCHICHHFEYLHNERNKINTYWQIQKNNLKFNVSMARALIK